MAWTVLRGNPSGIGHKRDRNSAGGAAVINQGKIIPRNCAARISFRKARLNRQLIGFMGGCPVLLNPDGLPSPERIVALTDELASDQGGVMPAKTERIVHDGIN